MIVGMHALIYSSDAEADRAHLRDVLGLPSVDAGGGWLIFGLPGGELGVHPATDPGPSAQELYLMCDDIEATIHALGSRGATFDGEVEALRFGRRIALVLPSGARLMVYQPAHPTALDLAR